MPIRGRGVKNVGLSKFETRDAQQVETMDDAVTAVLTILRKPDNDNTRKWLCDQKNAGMVYVYHLTPDTTFGSQRPYESFLNR